MRRRVIDAEGLKDEVGGKKKLEKKREQQSKREEF
jgi:hypothetical protein